MANIEKYDKAFVDAFTIEKGKLVGLTYQAILAWDSVGHMGLMAILEEVFDIMLETDDIIDFSSYERGKEILKKYGIEI